MASDRLSAIEALLQRGADTWERLGDVAFAGSLRQAASTCRDVARDPVRAVLWQERGQEVLP